MQSTDIAIWAYNTEKLEVLWGNLAARRFWNLDDQTCFSHLSSQQLAHLQQALALDQPFSLSTSNRVSRCFQAERVSDSTYLITEIPRNATDCEAHETPTVFDQNNLISSYDQSGYLIERSDLAQLIFNTSESRITDRFVDAEEAHSAFKQVELTDYSEGVYRVHTVQGERWHLIQITKFYVSATHWLYQMREIDIDPLARTNESYRDRLLEQQVLFEHAGTGVCFTKDFPDSPRQIVRCNRTFAEIYGYQVTELIGQSSAMLYPDTQEYYAIGNSAYPQLKEGTLFQRRLRMKRKNGSLFWSQIRGKMISPENPDLGYIWIVEDINDYVHANHTLKTLLHEHQLILDHAMVGIVFLKNRKVTHCNRRFEEIFGYNEGELKDSCSRQWYLSEADWLKAGAACYQPLSEGNVFRGEMLLSRKDGSPLWCDVRSKAINPSDLDQGSIWITMDITERKEADAALAKAHEELEQRVEERTEALAAVVENLHLEISERRIAEERVKHMALHDSLTGLPNRALLEERLEQAVKNASMNSRKLAVLFIDLDRFKHINDSLGHHEGDQLLIQVANKLHEVIKHSDTVARLGGDEFVIILDNIRNVGDVNHIIDQIHTEFQQEIQLALQDVHITPSIGIALYPNDGDSAIELMKNADAAMYHAKDNGRNCSQFFTRGIDDSLQERIVLENALHQALKQQQFQLYYQPQVDVSSNKMIGAEALIRWIHPKKGVIPPDAFIPLAEETGLIVEIGRWVLESACQQLRAWTDQGMDNFVVSVNLSALQVQQPDFVNDVCQIVKRCGIQPERLDLELTESMIMRNAEETIKTLKQLSEQGLQISIDDFGTGYSSLSYLKRFPLDKLKIDRSFVNDITNDPDDAMICRTIISMAHNLNLKVIAEGVETNEQQALMRSYGCELYQGYLFSRPVPASEIPALMDRSFEIAAESASNTILDFIEYRD